jgi:hypothetical protein
MPDIVKETVSKVSRTTNKAVHALGGDSARLDFFGHPHIHPLAGAYFTQAVIRYGDYIANLAVVPAAPIQRSPSDTLPDTSRDDDALRAATVGHLRERDAVFDLRAQLRTSLKSTPVEDASKDWSEEESPTGGAPAHVAAPGRLYQGPQSLCGRGLGLLRVSRSRRASATGFNYAGAASGLTRDVSPSPRSEWSAGRRAVLHQ